MNREMLNEILEKHEKWLNNDVGGEQANFSHTYLNGANLSGLNLGYANFDGADLYGANLSCANLRGASLNFAKLKCADLCGANLGEANLDSAILNGANLKHASLNHTNLFRAHLHEADLYGACLYGADLRGAELYSANLCDADFTDADLSEVKYNEHTAYFAMQCPEEGSFIGYKKAQNIIVKLEICADAKRSSATTRKCRCSAAKVLSLTYCDGTQYEHDSVRSTTDYYFVYKVGEVVSVDDFDDDRWNECSTGIHFFITRQEAVNY